MFGKKKKNAIAYGIIGLGRFGEALATELARSGAELLVMDREEERVREMRDLTENALVVNTLDKKTLTETGIQNCDIAVVCIGEHMESSILTTLNLVSLGIPTVIAKATSPEHGEILKRLGAQVVYPERDMAIRLATRLSNSRVLDFIQLSEKLNITKLSVPDALVQKSVVELNLRARFGLNIIAIEHNGQVIEHVDPNYRFCPGDILILSGSNVQVACRQRTPSVRYTARDAANTGGHLLPVRQPDFIRDQRDELRVGRFSLSRINRISKQRVQRLHPAAVPRNLDRMANGALDSARCRFILFRNFRIQRLCDRAEHIHVLD